MTETKRSDRPLAAADLTYEDVAAQVGSSRRGIERAVARGELACHKLGKLVRFRQEAVDEWCDRGRVGGES